VGLYSSLAIGADGSPAIAYMAAELDDGSGGKLSQLRYAVAGSEDPGEAGDWTVETLDEAAVTCAGLCGDGKVCAVLEDGEQCAVDSGDCPDACGDGSVCVGGTCVVQVADPPAYDIPAGVGLYASNVLLPDGRPVVVYYDRNQGDLVLQARSGGWERTALDAGADADAGMWADALVDQTGTVHVAYQDAVGDQLLYTSWSDGTAGGIEVVDDGTRSYDTRTHPVGASAALFIGQGGALSIAYQDGATSDLVIARRDGGAWTRDDLLVGPLLDGFDVSASTDEGRSALASYQYDQSIQPPGSLEILINP
jgi:hypothetical protein